MKIGRFLFGVAAGMAASYLIVKSTEYKYVKPEKVIQQVKNKCRDKMTIVGSWIQVEPVSEEMNGIQYNIYQGGLTGEIDGTPKFVEFKVDADTGTILNIQS